MSNNNSFYESNPHNPANEQQRKMDFAKQVQENAIRIKGTVQDIASLTVLGLNKAANLIPGRRQPTYPAREVLTARRLKEAMVMIQLQDPKYQGAFEADGKDAMDRFINVLTFAEI